MHRAAFVLLLIAMLSFGAAQAQEAYESPLLALLATVPDTANNRTQVLFGDRAAIEAAYPPARIPDDFGEFLFANENNDDPGDDVMPVLLWTRIYMGTGSSTVGRYMSVSEEMPNILGFDYFDVRQELSYGTPPLQTLHLSGDFDGEAIRAAISAEGYVQADAPAGELWCPEAGCDAGSRVNFEARNQANLFGGDLGRQFPLFITGTSLLGSPAEDVMREHIAVATDDQPSLADAPDYAAAVEMLTRGGVLMQAVFFPPSVLPTTPTEGEGLPAYTLLAFGDVATSETQEARLVLIYTEQATAAQVAEDLPGRIEETLSLVANISWGEMLESRRVTNIVSEVVMTDAGLPAVVVTFQGERGTPEQILDTTINDQDEVDFVLPGDTFLLLTNAVYRQDLAWLAIEER